MRAKQKVTNESVFSSLDKILLCTINEKLAHVISLQNEIRAIFRCSTHFRFNCCVTLIFVQQTVGTADAKIRKMIITLVQ